MGSAFPPGRGSYRGLIALPVYGLYDADERLVGTIRARKAEDARTLFKRAGLSGVWVRRIRDA